MFIIFSIIVSSPNGLKEDIYTSGRPDYIIDKYKLNMVKQGIYDILSHSMYTKSDFDNNSVDIYISYKDVLSMDSLYMCKKRAPVQERLYQIKCRMVSQIKRILINKEVNINQLDFCGNLFLNLLPNVKECRNPLLKNDIWWLRRSRNAFKSDYDKDRRALTDREFQFLLLLGMMSVYAGVPRQDSYNFAKDLLNLCSSYENNYLKT